MTKDEALETKDEPVAWSRASFIEDDDGRSIGTDDPELAWGKEPPDEFGWWPLYTTPQPKQEQDEPVAWGMDKDGVILDVICPAEHEREEGSYTIPLYTTPQQRKPLTDEHIDEIPFALLEQDQNGMSATEALREFARAIEFAHGIKE